MLAAERSCTEAEIARLDPGGGAPDRHEPGNRLGGDITEGTRSRIALPFDAGPEPCRLVLLDPPHGRWGAVIGTAAPPLDIADLDSGRPLFHLNGGVGLGPRSTLVHVSAAASPPTRREPT